MPCSFGRLAESVGGKPCDFGRLGDLARGLKYRLAGADEAK